MTMEEPPVYERVIQACAEWFAEASTKTLWLVGSAFAGLTVFFFCGGFFSCVAKPESKEKVVAVSQETIPQNKEKVTKPVVVKLSDQDRPREIEFIGEGNRKTQQERWEDELETLPPLRTTISREQGKIILSGGNIKQWRMLGTPAKVAITLYAARRLHSAGDPEFVAARAENYLKMLDSPRLAETDTIKEAIALMEALDGSIRQEKKAKQGASSD